MSVRTLYDQQEGRAVMYDSVSGIAFGPVISWGEDMTHPLDRLRAFMAWLDDKHIEPRDVSESILTRLHTEWEGSQVESK